MPGGRGSAVCGVDVVSISLNASNAKEYQSICRCKYGEAGFDAMLSFAKSVKEYVPEVVMSIVDVRLRRSRRRARGCAHR